jgi:hypothetical protein
MQRWRLLFHQYTLGLAHGENCPAANAKDAGPDPSLAAVGGYAESTSSDIRGGWKYHYFKPACVDLALSLEAISALKEV